MKLTDRTIRLITLLLVALMLITCQAIAKPAKSNKKAKKLKTQLGSVQSKIKVAKQKLHQTKLEQHNVSQLFDATEQALENTQGDLAQNKLKLLKAQADLDVTQERLDRTRKQLSRRQGLLKRRVVDMYEGEDMDYVNVVLGSTDMWSFLTRAYYLQKILESDTKLITQINSDKLSIEKDKARKARRVTEISSLQVRLVSERDRVASLADQRKQQLNSIESDAALLEKVLDDLERESQRIENTIRDMYKTQKNKKNLYPGKLTGSLSLPVSGRITSQFGYRVHPITGVYKLHTGVDIAAGMGTAIHAAANGKVIMAGWYGAYGNAVIIDHGSHVSTLYGHCSRLLVSVGDSISKGQVIAKVGSTGYSTGAHCHFEKRVNGTPVNPR